jgi:hypothetical protein
MNISKSHINSEFLKTILNIASNDSNYTMIPYSDCSVIGFRQDDIVMIQDDTDYHSRIGITVDYDGNITSQMTQRELVEKYGDLVNGIDIDDAEYGFCGNEFEELYGLPTDHFEIPENVVTLNTSRFHENNLDLSKMFNNYDSFRESHNLELKLTEINKINHEEPILDTINHFHSFIRSVYMDEYDWYECEFNGSKLTVINSVLYIISDTVTKNIKNMLYAPSTSLQEGDGGTYIYLLNGKHILVYNGGDVNSAVFIKND